MYIHTDIHTHIANQCLSGPPSVRRDGGAADGALMEVDYGIVCYSVLCRWTDTCIMTL